MKDNTLKIGLLFISLISVVNSLESFKPCLECLYENQGETAFYCSSSETCKFANSTECGSDDMIWEASECVEAIEPCENIEFNSTSFQAEY